MDVQRNGPFRPIICPVADRWEESNSGEVNESVKILAAEIRNNTAETKNITKLLLWVVCIIALAEKAPEIIDKLMKIL